MKKVILLTLMMPYLASGQIIESGGTGSVIISEIMADPSPPVGLPAREYLEVHNRNSFPVSLEGWKYVSGESIVLLPQVEIGPLEYLILVHENYRNEYLSMGRCAGLKQFPVLTDGGKTLRLLDAAGKLIHGVEYSVSWYGEKLKTEGGWSLEMIDCNHPFSGSANWRASRSPTGGTPGKVNSVDGLNPDEYFAGIMNVFPFDNMHLLVQFSEPVLMLEGDPGAIQVDVSPVGSIVYQDPLFRTFIATASAPVSEGKVHSLSVEDRITDFAGNRARKKDFLFGLTSKAAKGDILFNELFFDPVDDGYDYIELVNVSDRILDASGLYLASVSEKGDTTGLYPVSAEGRCIMPGSYYAITCGKQSVTNSFSSSDPDCIFEVSSLPSMNNDEGHLLLLTRGLDIIDEVIYSEDMHFGLLSGHEGIALEKTGPRNSSLDPASWHSASGSAGWGTPGKRNSVFSEVPALSGTVTMSTTRISPDNDGCEDFLSVHISFPVPGNVLSITVFDETGYPIKDVARNMLVGTESDILWDGTAYDGALVQRGIYVILISSFDDKGRQFRAKKACAVIR